MEQQLFTKSDYVKKSNLRAKIIALIKRDSSKQKEGIKLLKKLL